MQIEYRKKFLKQLADLPASVRPKIEQFVFEDLTKATSIFELGKIEKMQGYDGFYKARFGDYRVGLMVKDDVVVVATVMHRKEIYKFFP
jgi:mRNA interferase RelE/StbE